MCVTTKSAEPVERQVEPEELVGARPASLDEASVLVSPDHLENFDRRLEALSGKAERFGLQPIEVLARVEVAYTRHYEYVGSDCERQLMTLVPVGTPGSPKNSPPVILTRVHIRYPIVKLGDWRVVGLMELLEDSPTALAFRVGDLEADGRELSERSRQPLRCEHCRVSRGRKSVYLLRDPDGAYKQVGSTCLQDFTGIDPSAALWFAQMSSLVRLCEGEAEEFAGRSRSNAVYTKQYLADVLFLVDRFGFVSTKKAQEEFCEPTYSGAIELQAYLERSPERHAEYLADRDSNDARAAEVLQWMLAKTEESDFDRNAKLILAREVIKREPRHLAIAAAVVAVYARAKAEKVEASRPSDWVGQPGQKLEAMLQVDRVVEIPNHFSRASRFMLLLKDQLGNVLKWTTTAAPRALVAGDPVPFRARFKVAEHDVYKERRQTIVTHLRLICWRRPNFDHLRRLNIDQGREAVAGTAVCG